MRKRLVVDTQAKLLLRSRGRYGVFRGTHSVIHKSKAFIIVTIAAFGLAACDESISGLPTSLASLSGGLPGLSAAEDTGALSPEERQLRQVERTRRNRVAQATGVGCVAGGAAAWLKNQIEGNSTSVSDVAIGAALGCSIGFASGIYINSRTKSYASEQERYRALIAAADQDIAEAQSLNTTTSRLITQQRRKISRLNNQYAAQQISRDDYRAQIASAKNNAVAIDNQIQGLSGQAKLIREDAAKIKATGTDTSDLERRISGLEKQRADLEQKRRQLTSLYNDVPPDVGAPVL